LFIQALNFQERQPQVADAGQQSMQRHLVYDEASHGRDDRPIFTQGDSDRHTIESFHPICIEAALHLDLVNRWSVKS
jgi:hypothetical protein